jgi:hypothetical protein
LDFRKDIPEVKIRRVPCVHRCATRECDIPIVRRGQRSQTKV